MFKKVVDKTMKIAMIGQKGIPATSGGIERHVEELSVRLARAGHEVFVYTRPYYVEIPNSKIQIPNKSQTSNSKLQTMYKGVHRIFLPSIPTKHLDAISHTFLASLHALMQGFDIIHYHGVGPSTLSFIPRLFSKAKVVATFHCRDKFHQKWGRLARAYLAFGEMATCKFPHKTICVSKTIQKFTEQKFNKKTEYIPNGVDVNSEFRIQNSEILDKFGLAKDQYILTVARLVKHKGIHYLIKAFNKIQNSEFRIQNLKLAIVGDSAFTDDYVRYLKNLAKGNKNIIFCGRQSGKTLAQLFSDAYLYVHPSEREGLAITILEALAYKKCVLTSDIPENREAISGYGFTFRNKDINNLKEKLEYLLANPGLVRNTGQKAQQYVKENYNWDDITQKTIKLYKSLIKFPKPVLSKKEKQSLAAIKQTIGNVIR